MKIGGELQADQQALAADVLDAGVEELRADEGLHRGGVLDVDDGEPLEDPHPLAPPLWLLQVATGGELLASLGALGGSPTQIALGYDGARDCYVLGGKAAGASVWVDKETYQVARVGLADGTQFRFLAWASRGGAILPGTIEIATPTLTFTLELTNPTVATPAADAFTESWLSAP